MKVNSPLSKLARGLGQLQILLLGLGLECSRFFFQFLLRNALATLDVPLGSGSPGSIKLLHEYRNVGFLILGALEDLEVDISERSPGCLAIRT